MSKEIIFSGQKQSWSLKQKIGAGDAGEVFLVESLIDSSIGILKRPSYSPFAGDFVRQASQIEKEGKVLKALEQLIQSNEKIITPRLLDQSKPGTGLTNEYFIIISKAKGIDLGLISKAIHNGNMSEVITKALPQKYEQSLVFMLEYVIREQKIPDLVFLRTILYIIEFLEKIHTPFFQTSTDSMNGVVWNDIKPEHIFWDPKENSFTLIDFGNAVFIDASGSSKDRQYSSLDDYQQFIAEMGLLIYENSEGLFNELGWPNKLPSDKIFSNGIKELKNTVQEKLDRILPEIILIRENEKIVFSTKPNSIKDYIDLKNIQEKILFFGEIPDTLAKKNVFLSLAKLFLSNNNLDSFSYLLEIASEDIFFDFEILKILGKIMLLDYPLELKKDCLNYCINEDFPALVWELRRNMSIEISSQQVNEIIFEIRILSYGSQTKNPKVELNRVLFALKSILNQNEDNNQELLDLAESIEQIHSRWIQYEPDPPNSDLQYTEILEKFDELEHIIPKACDDLIYSLKEPTAQIEIILDNWEKKEYGAARLGLRRLLLIDPERSRIIRSDQAMQNAPNWLTGIKNGPAKDESFIDFITRSEIEGREIRNRTGPTSWLGTILSILRELRNQNDPTEVLMNNKDGIRFFSWLVRLDANRPIFAAHHNSIKLGRETGVSPIEPTIFGTVKRKLGLNQDLSLISPLDTWVAEARGSSARVILGQLKGINNSTNQVAIKVMRPDQVEYALPLFIEEVHVLTLLKNIPGIIKLYEMGFINLLDNSYLLDEKSTFNPEDHNGEIIRYGRDSIHNFLRDIGEYSNEGWLPYLALERFDQKNNLIKYYDIGYNKGRFQPIIEGLRIAIQLCDILAEIHTRNIVYRDHKILHYYWNEKQNGIHLIDWNIAKHHPEGLSTEEIQFDLVQFGARGLHHLFTGRPAPGALPLGPNRSDDIDTAAKTYESQWTYDDQRLPNYIKELLDRVLSNKYHQAKKLRMDLFDLFANLTELAKEEPK